MIKYISIIASLFIINVAYSQINIKIVGNVSGNPEGFTKVYFGNQLAKDSAEIINGKFEMSIVENEPGARAISIDYDRGKRRMYSPLVLFFDKSGTIEVQFDIEKGLSSATVGGMKSAVNHFNFVKNRAKVYVGSRKSTLEKFGTTALNKNDKQYEAANTHFEKGLGYGFDSLLTEYFDSESVVSAHLVLNVLASLPIDKSENYYNNLSEAVKKSDAGATLYAKIQGLKNVYIGAVVKNFTLPDAQNKQQEFDKYKGKYILLDFWASWCSPCRASFPRIREIYSKLQGKNFEIVNISIDQNKAAWLKAVEEEGNPWPQLYDDKKISSSFFNVSAIPTCYLIDPTGKIIMKEIGFDSKGGGTIEKKLEEIFSVKF
ncbi:TlpA disulfide reductase family protein [Sphingobacterium bovistauri]|uniref:AhpC/TSA family protein n=1 Tax=Sphingobacterium bovistauri TaxID=2781959 RepID=A0ABS7Z638_9SPHI|nr:TlpA disulfide reductase family protein [Sphingobacterium bovistauri]MCA5005022.1 AhpC/TSA family protein [Sphingobacterium bovistauri]